MAEKTTVFAFGRMNPPTVGHEKLVNKVKEVAKQHKADHLLVVSHSQDAKKNPLTGEQKLKHVKRFFPGVNVKSSSKETPTFLQHAAELHKSGTQHLIMVAGSDRIQEYHDKLHQYNGEGKMFNFKSIKVKSAGERDPDAEGVEGMSASKMREHAKNSDFGKFKQGIPSHVSDDHAHELMKDVRSGMKLTESFGEWINENKFFGGRFRRVILSGTYGHNHNVWYSPSIETNGLIDIQAGNSNSLRFFKSFLNI
jgi:nicotinamide mononucleotide adenylyltransferase